MSIYNRIYHILIEGQTDWSQEEEGDDFQRTSKQSGLKKNYKQTPKANKQFQQQQKRKQTQYQKDLQRKWPGGRSRTQKPS